MNRRFLAGAVLLSALFGGVQAGHTMTSQNNSVKEIKSGAVESIRDRKRRIIHQAGGLDVIGSMGVPGYDPKTYGILFGHGNKRKHTNLLRCSHKAKLKRR